MATNTTHVTSDETQAVQLPKDDPIHKDGREVEIINVADAVMSPAAQRWAAYFADPHKLSDDFLIDRDQGTFEEREPFD